MCVRFAPQRQFYAPIVTLLLIVACCGAFGYDLTHMQQLSFGDGPHVVAGESIDNLGQLTLYAPSLEADGEWYRTATAGLVHFGWTHITMNMILLFLVGRLIEGRYGALPFITLFGAGLLGGSLGAVLLDYKSQVGGASGAVLGLLGALAVLQKMSGRGLVRSGIGPLIVLNIALSLLPNVSLGGHLGGLAAGVVGGLMLGVAERMGPRASSLGPIAICALAFAAFAATIPAARWALEQGV